ncbi:MAG: hypothetical protein QNJ70_20860 [Xenococcaceae cyanobacterium MO_207.B15]|nr:hypothetical protein [Xenococcaceae cyanobacterium MO_207.B15]
MYILTRITSQGAIALGLILVSIDSWPLNAQNNTSEDHFLGGIEVERNEEWNFTSEDKFSSIKDNIQELEEYSISELDLEADTQLIEEEWGNRGEVENNAIKLEFYEY